MIRIERNEGKASTQSLPTRTSEGELPCCPICRVGGLFLRGHTVFCVTDGEIGQVKDPRGVALWHEPGEFRFALSVVAEALGVTFDGVSVSTPDRRFPTVHEATASTRDGLCVKVSYLDGDSDPFQRVKSSRPYCRHAANARGQAPVDDKHHDPGYVLPDAVHKSALALSELGYQLGGGMLRNGGMYYTGLVKQLWTVVQVELGWPVAATGKPNG